MREGNSGQVVVELKLSGKIELPSATTEWPHRKSVAQGLGERTAIRRTRFRRTRSAASSARPAERAFAAAPRSPEFCLFPAGHSKPRFRPAPRNHPTQREFVLKEIQEGDVMTRSVEELRRESERSRAELAATVDQLGSGYPIPPKTSATRFRRNTSNRKSPTTSATRPRAGSRC
jgi:hypothetical protein